jgi:hypothetical protein
MGHGFLKGEFCNREHWFGMTKLNEFGPVAISSPSVARSAA